MQTPEHDGEFTVPAETDQSATLAIWEAIKTHNTRVDEVLPSGDVDEIKRLYVEFGELLEQAIGADPDAAPVLSFPETGPVVAAAAAQIKGRVLDAGCGPNPVLSILLGRDNERLMIGLDIGLATVRLAKRRAEAAGTKLLCVVGDVEALPFLDRSFDGSVCEDTIEHVPNDALGVSELGRVLKSRGSLVLATPNRNRLDVVRDRLRDTLKGERRPAESYYAATSHLREYTWRSLERLTEPSFVTRRRASVGWSGTWKARVASRLVQRWPFRIVSRMVVLLLELRSDRRES